VEILKEKRIGLYPCNPFRSLNTHETRSQIGLQWDDGVALNSEIIEDMMFKIIA
jgi:hypothetical protein